ncbi:hypothetical protein A9Q83_10885 [Alphaproteobacteria bacterium 46_93_T64]|nr:hypothetical protein A9Q83_10885 [Alphaproteobacteria bacterium 46_93_T64]
MRLTVELGSIEDEEDAKLKLDPIWQELPQTKRVIVDCSKRILQTVNYVLVVCVALFAFEVGKFLA